MSRSTLPPSTRRLPDGRFKTTLDIPQPDGSRRQTSKTGNRAEVIAWYAETRAAIGNGTYVALTDVTVDQQLDGWLLAKKRAVKPTTWSGYVDALKPVRKALGVCRLQSVTKADVEQLMDDSERRGRSPRTANLMLTVLRAALQAAVVEGSLQRNVAALVAPARQTRYEAKTWTAAELTTFLDSIADHPLRAGFELSCLGLRRGEVVGLRWSDVDLDAPSISITTTRVVVSGATEQSTPKSERSRRVLPLDQSPEIVAVLRTARRAAGLRARTAETTVVVDPLGEPLRPEFYGDELTRAMVAAGVPRIRVHDVRHTVATLMLLAGSPVHVVAAWLGDDPAVLLRTYAHAIPSSLSSAAASLPRRSAVV